jgi:glycosyltransferase involved in cell wall biosynthesis
MYDAPLIGARVRLGFIVTPGMVNSLYRVAVPMHGLEERGHEVIWPVPLDDDLPMRQLFSCDLVHCFRREERTADLEALSRRGVAISVDNDDDLGELGVYEGVAGLNYRRGYAKRAALLATQARQADLVTTPSPVIAEKYERAGVGNVVVIGNYLDPRMDCFGFRSKHDGVVVGWIAGSEHNVDVEPLGIAKTLARLLDLHDDLSVITVGVKLNLPRDRYEHIEQVSHRELLKVVSRMDIGIAPLVDNPFNRARSNVKLKEYGAAGATWLASPVGPYLGLGAKQGGALVSDQDWFEAIDRLVRSPGQRRRLSRRALKWAKTQTIDRHADVWEAEFERAIGLAAARQRQAHAATAAR